MGYRQTSQWRLQNAYTGGMWVPSASRRKEELAEALHCKHTCTASPQLHTGALALSEGQQARSYTGALAFGWGTASPQLHAGALALTTLRGANRAMGW